MARKLIGMGIALYFGMREWTREQGEQTMTIKQTIKAVREMGLTCVWLSDTKEFRVNLPGAQAGSGYYTNDSSDAIATARFMMAYIVR